MIRPGGIEALRPIPSHYERARRLFREPFCVRLPGSHRDLECAHVVVSKQLGVIGRPLPCGRLDPLRHRLVPFCPRCSGNPPVGHVPGKGMPEGVFLFALDRRVAHRADPLPGYELAEGAAHVVAATHGVEGALPEHLAYDRRILDGTVLVVGEHIESGPDERLHGFRHRDRVL